MQPPKTKESVEESEEKGRDERKRRSVKIKRRELVLAISSQVLEGRQRAELLDMETSL